MVYFYYELVIHSRAIIKKNVVEIYVVEVKSTVF